MTKEYLRLADKAYDQLEAKIISLELEPGRIYSEAELSEIIGMGRTPMREGLLRLAKEKLVEMIPRRGVRISNIDLGSHIALLETRKALDVLIVTRAAKRAGPQQKKKLLECSQRMLHAGEHRDLEAYRLADSEVDALMAQASRNEFAVEAVAHLYAHCKRFWSFYRDHLDITGYAKRHAELAQAVAQANPDAARDAVVAIVDDQIEFTRRALDL